MVDLFLVLYVTFIRTRMLCLYLVLAWTPELVFLEIILSQMLVALVSRTSIVANHCSLNLMLIFFHAFLSFICDEVTVP